MAEVSNENKQEFVIMLIQSPSSNKFIHFASRMVSNGAETSRSKLKYSLEELVSPCYLYANF